MDAIIASNTVPLANVDQLPSTGTPQYPTNGNPIGNVPPTEFPAYHYAMMMVELLNLVTGTNIAKSGANTTQILQSIKRVAASNILTVSGNTVLTADNAGLVLVNAAGGPVTITLPVAAALNGSVINSLAGATTAEILPFKFIFLRTDGTENQVVIQVQGTDQFAFNIFGTQCSLPNSASRQLIADGVSLWREVGDPAGYGSTEISALATTLTTANLNQEFSFFAASGVAQTAALPSYVSNPVRSGEWIGVTRAVSTGISGTLTVTTPDGLIDTGAGLVTSITLQAGESAKIWFNGVCWTATGTFMFRYVNFTKNQNLASSGYIRLPGGFILQWGFASASGSGARTITQLLPLAFPNQFLASWANETDLQCNALNAAPNGANFLASVLINIPAANLGGSTTPTISGTVNYFYFAIGS